MKKFVVAKLLKVGDADAEEYLFPETVVQQAVDKVYDQVRDGHFFVYKQEVGKRKLNSILDVIGVVKMLVVRDGFLWADIEFVETDAKKEFERAVDALNLDDMLNELFVSVGLGSTNDENVVMDDYELTGVCVRNFKPERFKKKSYEKVG